MSHLFRAMKNAFLENNRSADLLRLFLRQIRAKQNEHDAYWTEIGHLSESQLNYGLATKQSHDHDRANHPRKIATWAATTSSDWPPIRLRQPFTRSQIPLPAWFWSHRRSRYSVRTTVHSWPAVGPGATIVGSGCRAPAPFAAFANGTAAHAWDFDDNFLAALTHASAVLVPALLALSEETGASGADIIDGYLVSWVCAAIGRGVNRSHYLKASMLPRRSDASARLRRARVFKLDGSGPPAP